MGALRTHVEAELVRALHPLDVRYKASVKLYNGEFSKADDLDQIRAALDSPLPLILLSTSNATYRLLNTERNRAAQDLTIEMLVASGSLRSRDERTTGGMLLGADPGIYTLLEGIRNILFGSDLGLSGCGYLAPSIEEPWVHRPDLCIWRITYQTTLDAARPAADDADVTTVHGHVNLSSSESAAANPVIQLNSEVSS
jgi:hypothetical protein